LFFENLQRCSREFGAPDVIVVGLGPGSYAGVRIAIAAAVGLRAASTAKLAGIASVCGMDTAAREYCVIGDARRESFFFARVSDGRLVEGPSLHSRAELENS
jgi:tRNA A37 threonylcarbamoyladenosine modification protein TsaB